MKKVSFFNNFKKLKYLLIIGGIILLVFTFLPTFGRYKNRVSFYNIVEWNGSIASSYRSGSGTIIDPYIISNGAEFAYFAEQLKYTDYKNVYFELSNDIVLNKGIFNYDGSITYSINDNNYQISEYSNEYDDGIINKFDVINKFNGHLNGNLYRIYGLYITSDTESDLALFNSIGGSISNLYISNALIYGGNSTSMLAINSEDASVKNIMIDGFVVGKNSNLEKVYNINEIHNGNSIDLSGYNIPGNIISINLSGTFIPSDDTNKLIINNNEFNAGSFSLDLESIKNIEYSLLFDSEYVINDLKLSVVSDYGAASAFVINSKNTDFYNVVNKAYIYAKNYSSGFIYSTNGDLVINNAYNIASIDSLNTSGFISNVYSGNVELKNIYNSGSLNGNIGSIVLNVNSGVVNITNSFDTCSNYIINEIVDGVVNVDNSYSLNSTAVKSGEVNGEFKVIDIGSLKNNNYIKDSFELKEFISISDTLVNEDNIWVFENDSYPILYIDDLNRPCASINVSIYSWNTLAYDLNKYKFANDFTFAINTTDALANIKKIEYYLHKSTTSLSSLELENISDWKEYSDIINVNEQGNYIIYAKITDGDNKEYYINSDILIINSNSIASVSVQDYEWSSIVSVPSNVYLDSESKLIIDVDENFADVNNVSYYYSNKHLDENDLDLLNNEWNDYVSGVDVIRNESNIYYFKIIDNNGLVSYISTDYITIDGYSLNSVLVGREEISDNKINISNNSTISFNYSYSDSSLFVEGYKHNIVSNILLPSRTKIILIDNINNKKYMYITDESTYGYSDDNRKAVYSLSLFNEIGSFENKLFNESTFIGEINDDFTIIFDFSDTVIDENIKDINITFEVSDSLDSLVIPTLKDNIKTFNIYNFDSMITLDSNYEGNIDYNKDYSNSIDFSIDVNNLDENNNVIYDSLIQDKKYGLEIKMIDNNTGSVMGKNYLSNVQFKYNDNVYMPYSNGIVNINVEDNMSGNLIIDTYVNDMKIEGDYSFYVCAYNSYDGTNYTDIKLDNCLNIPINILENIDTDYNFDVIISAEDRILSKNTDKTLEFKILYQSDLEDPNIRVSLYEKNELTAYNQSYSIVDLKDYIYDELNSSNNIYYLSKNIKSSSNYETYSLSFKNSTFNMNGYKLIFDLYDGDKKIGSIEKKFIVKGDE